MILQHDFLDSKMNEVNDSPGVLDPGQSKTMRICIVAEHASYQFGGEAVLPLHYFSRLRARGIDTWLVVHARTRAELEAAFPAERERILYIEDAWFHKVLFRLSRFLPRRISESTLGLLSQLITQSLARRTVRMLIGQQSVGLVHQPIPVSPRFPSLMAHLGVPVVMGPMNGGMEYPAAFRRTESALSRIGVSIGRGLSGFVNSVLPGKKLASVVLVANERTRLALPPCVRGTVIEFAENGVDLNTWSNSRSASSGNVETEPRTEAETSKADGARFVFIGRLVDWKGVDMAIEALAHVPGAQLEIIGDGPMRAPWQRRAEDLGVSSRVVFSGWLPQNVCAMRLRSAVALVLPSIYESGGAVVLEAMATGTPVIAAKWGGPIDYLDASCGYLVEPSSRVALIEGFAGAMRELTNNSEMAAKMGITGQQRVIERFDWERKVDRMIVIYRQAMHRDSTLNPAFK
jgi:glycosyltransferase involved in cell wall biosynthesis